MPAAIMPIEERLSSTCQSLAPFDPAALDDEAASIFALTPDLRVAFVSRGFCQFASSNGATWKADTWLDAPVMSVIPEVLRRFYEGLFDVARAERHVVEHEYECSSQTTYRRFRMRLHPCDSGALLVVNTLLLEAPQTTQELASLEAAYRGKGGFMTQCTHCRCVKRVDGADRWDFVPAFVERMMPRTSHGLCQVCADYYYPEDGGSPRFPARR